jgi:hypothetical protein
MNSINNISLEICLKIPERSLKEKKLDEFDLQVYQYKYLMIMETRHVLFSIKVRPIKSLLYTSYLAY